jgi:hypothetical protein
VFVEGQLSADHGRLISFVKQTEPLMMAGGADASRVDRTQMEHLMRAFHDSCTRRT